MPPEELEMLKMRLGRGLSDPPRLPEHDVLGSPCPQWEGYRYSTVLFDYVPAWGCMMMPLPDGYFTVVRADAPQHEVNAELNRLHRAIQALKIRG